MKISLNEIKKMVKIPEGVTEEELIELIGSRLVEVEGVEDWSDKYKGICIAEVEKCEKIPGTHLSLCQINAGKAGKKWIGKNMTIEGVADVEAEQAGLVQVVCGAPNVQVGMLAVWIMPGAVVPETWGGENFELSVRKLRGYESHGMLAALDELDLGEDHEGILEICPGSAKAGESFAERFGLNDLILDIENKSLTHRPDCFGIIGFAREVAGILGQKFKNNALPEDFSVSSASSTLKVQIQNPDICGRYTCAVVEMEGVTEKSKYLSETDVFLAKAGMRGISKIVDVTNVLMLLTGQPLHAFDYDKFVAEESTLSSSATAPGRLAKDKSPREDKADSSTPTIINVRTAAEGEELELLDGKTIKCDANDILIAAGERPVALAGAMGGKSTEIDDKTRRVLLESASFSLYHLRKTQMKHGIFSEAITRFTKGVPTGMASRALHMAVKELGGEVLAAVDAWSDKERQKAGVVKLTTDDVNSLLGTNYSAELMERTLENVGFEVKSRKLTGNGASVGARQMEVSVPYWRTDIHIHEDIIEEVGRLLGFDNIPQDLPKRPFVGARRNSMFELKTRLRELLSQRFGANEVLTYSFVSKKLQEKVGEDVGQSYEIVNSISPELQVFRQSIVPSLLEKAYENVKSSYKDFALYEFNQVTNKGLGRDEDGVPNMQNHLGVVCIDDYYRARNLLLQVLMKTGIDAKVERIKDGRERWTYYEPVRTARVLVRDSAAVSQKTDQEDGEWREIGVIGEIRQGVKKAMKLPEVSGFEVDLDVLATIESRTSDYKPLSKFPMVERDVTAKVEVEKEYAALHKAVIKAFEKQPKLVYSVSPVSIYQAGNEDKTKNVTLRLKFASLTKTLTSEEIQAMMKQITRALEKEDAKVI